MTLNNQSNDGELRDAIIDWWNDFNAFTIPPRPLDNLVALLQDEILKARINTLEDLALRVDWKVREYIDKQVIQLESQLTKSLKEQKDD